MRISIRGMMLLVGTCIVAGVAGWAQQSQKPAAPAISTDLAFTFAVERSQVVPGQCCFWFKGGGMDIAVNFWKGLGIAAGLNGDHASNVTQGVDENKISIMAGPRYTFTAWNGHDGPGDPRRLQLFVQGLFGDAHAFNSLFPTNGAISSGASSLVVQTGGGLNLYMKKHVGLRLLEADYVRTELPNAYTDTQNDLRLSFGVTYHFAAAAVPPPPVTLACSATPESIFPGDPVTVTATAGSLDPKLNAIYSWSGTGVTGAGTTATVATGALAAGTYTVQASVKEGKPGKEGLLTGQSANCSASFTVKAYEPPTISCSASPSTIKPGESSAITASGMSPQNRPLTYSFAASAGTVSGSGNTATYSSVGAPTGITTVICNVTDDKGQTATANTSVTITAPYVAPVPHTQALCSINFLTDKKRPTRVDNEAKACLDQVALNLQQQPDAKVVVVGEVATAEKTPKKGQKHAKVEDIAAERAVNTKDYLVTEKGIDASRVSVATGASDAQTVENYLVPAGATFSADVSGTTPVDESVIKPIAPKPVAGKQHKKEAVPASKPAVAVK